MCACLCVYTCVQINMYLCMYAYICVYSEKQLFLTVMLRAEKKKKKELGPGAHTTEYAWRAGHIHEPDHTNGRCT